MFQIFTAHSECSNNSKVRQLVKNHSTGGKYIFIETREKKHTQKTHYQCYFNFTILNKTNHNEQNRKIMSILKPQSLASHIINQLIKNPTHSAHMLTITRSTHAHSQRKGKRIHTTSLGFTSISNCEPLRVLTKIFIVSLL